MNLGRELFGQCLADRFKVLKCGQHLRRRAGTKVAAYAVTFLLVYPLPQPPRSQPLTGIIHQQLGGTRAGGTNEGVRHREFGSSSSE